MPESQFPYTNRLIGEDSPYLQQHAHNPVQWYPWSTEAFKKAQEEDKPVFLSIGYSTCHWCHVMEKESFTNGDIAGILNKYYISIKVDREQRPDVDSYYMSAVQALTGSGGWPLSVFITPGKEVFYGGTYFPPEDRWGRPGFKTVLLSLSDSWLHDKAKILTAAASISRGVKQGTAGNSKKQLQTYTETVVSESVFHTVYDTLYRRFDQKNGGFGGAPKFPSPQNLLFLLRYGVRYPESNALPMVETTLKAMEQGGIYDQLGGGFHRYSTDEKWFLPHFEKMLYDQALLLRSYTEGAAALNQESFRVTAGGIIYYVKNILTSPEGGFYTAQDADSLPAIKQGWGTDEKMEGVFYLFAEKEIDSQLPPQDARIFRFYYGIKKEGNFNQSGGDAPSGHSILAHVHTAVETAQHFSTDEAAIKKSLQKSKEILYQFRQKRPLPAVDTKILTSWNGLMIASLAYASRVLETPAALVMAEQAADFVLSHMLDTDGKLLHSFMNGKASVPGMLEDYAFFIYGLIDLYQADFKTMYLEKAVQLMHTLVEDFWDAVSGGFYETSSVFQELPLRQKNRYDGAMPSGNSIAALDLILLSRILEDSDYEKMAGKLLQTFSHEISLGYLNGMLLSYDYLYGPSQEIVLSGDISSKAMQGMIRTLYSKYLPRKVVIFRYPNGIEAEKTTKLLPHLKDHLPVGGNATAYVCSNYTCALPVTTVEELKDQLA